jgi:hypothetical protein
LVFVRPIASEVWDGMIPPRWRRIGRRSKHGRTSAAWLFHQWRHRPGSSDNQSANSDRTKGGHAQRALLISEQTDSQIILPDETLKYAKPRGAKRDASWRGGKWSLSDQWRSNPRTPFDQWESSVALKDFLKCCNHSSLSPRSQIVLWP